MRADLRSMGGEIHFGARCVVVVVVVVAFLRLLLFVFVDETFSLSTSMQYSPFYPPTHTEPINFTSRTERSGG
jgi:hypothetical protein